MQFNPGQTQPFMPIPTPTLATTSPISLQLGDFINVIAPNNPQLAGQYYIYYVTSDTLFNVMSATDPSKQYVLDTNNLINYGIVGIEIISRADSPSYAQQHGLLPPKRVHIVFNTQPPSALDGQITRYYSSNDTIELQLDGVSDPIFLNFNFQGLSPQLGIQSIRIIVPAPAPAPAPSAPAPSAPAPAVAATPLVPTVRQTIQSIQDQSRYTMKNVEPNIILNRQEITELMDEELKPVSQWKTVDAHKFRYSLDEQLVDMMDDLLAAIPPSKRTRAAIRNISIQVQRFAQLRQMSSIFDTEGNVDGIKRKTPDIKPLIDQYFMGYSIMLPWIVPVAQTLRRIEFDPSAGDDFATEATNYIPTHQIYTQLADNVKSFVRTSKYGMYMKRALDLMQPHLNLSGETVSKSGILVQRPVSAVNSPIMAVLQNIDISANLSEFITAGCSAVKEKKEYRRLMRDAVAVMASFMPPMTRLDLTDDSTPTNLKTIRVPLTDPDILSVRSFITLPATFQRFSRIYLPNTPLIERILLHRLAIPYSRLLKRTTDKMIIQPITVDENAIATWKAIVETVKHNEATNADEAGPNAPMSQQMAASLANEWAGTKSSAAAADTVPSETAHYLFKAMTQFVCESQLDIGTSSVEKREEIYLAFVNAIIPRNGELFRLLQSLHSGSGAFNTMHTTVLRSVQLLEPYLVFYNDITYSLYRTVVWFVNDNMKRYMIRLQERTRRLADFTRSLNANGLIRSATEVTNPLIAIVSRDGGISANLLFGRDDKSNAGYGFHPWATVSELLEFMLHRDNMSLYTAVIAQQSADSGLSLSETVLDQWTNSLKKLQDDERRHANAQTMTNCPPIVIAKYYTNLTFLNADNNPEMPIYFDRRYDKTNYGLLDQFEKEALTMTSAELRAHMIREFQTKRHMTAEDAEYLADTLLDGRKRVRDGQFAILYLGYNPDTTKQVDYYVRRAGQWTLADESSLNPEAIAANTDASELLCDLQSANCVAATTENDKCESIDSVKVALKHRALNRILHEFDTAYFISKEAQTARLNDMIQHMMTVRMPNLARLELASTTQYDYDKLKLAAEIAATAAAVLPSPAAPLLRAILACNGDDETMQQAAYMVRFCQQFTREASHTDEDGHWLYCITTNTPLVPTFCRDLAEARITQDASLYDQVLANIKKDRGQVVDDVIVDKYSGWVIDVVPLVDQVEYTEEGFKEETKETMEAGLEDEDVTREERERAREEAETRKTETIRATTGPSDKTIDMIRKTFTDIVATLRIQNGARLEAIAVPIVIRYLEQKISNKASFVEYTQNKSKETLSKEQLDKLYVKYIEKNIVFATVVIAWVVIQSSIPPVKLDVRHVPQGCKPSLGGYPIEGTDTAGIHFMVCMLLNRRLSGSATRGMWALFREIGGSSKGTGTEGKIMSIVHKIVDSIKEIFNPAVAPLTTVRNECVTLMNTKYVYMVEYERETHRSALSVHGVGIDQWTTFMPPLFPFQLSSDIQAPITTDGLAADILRSMKSGNIRETEQLVSVAQSKIHIWSLAVIMNINHAIMAQTSSSSSSRRILETDQQIPYLQNMCCETSVKQHKSVLHYFADTSIDENRGIGNNIRACVNLSKNYIAQLQIVWTRMRTTIFKSRVNTKNVFPRLSDEFSEKTIYAAFIAACKLRTSQPIPTKLLEVCKLGADNKRLAGLGQLRSASSLDIEIMMLSNMGITYTSNDLRKLLQLVAHVIHSEQPSANADTVNVSDLLRHIYGHLKNVSYASLQWLNAHYLPMLNSTITSDESVAISNEHIATIVSAISTAQMRLIDTITQFSRDNGITHMGDQIKKVLSWNTFKTSGVSLDAYSEMQFYRTAISYVASVWPSMVLNSAPKGVDQIEISEHFGFTEPHRRRLEDMINAYYAIFQPFQNPLMRGVFNACIRDVQQLAKLAQSITGMFDTQIVLASGQTHGVMKSVLNTEVAIAVLKFLLVSVMYQWIEQMQKLVASQPLASIAEERGQKLETASVADILQNQGISREVESYAQFIPTPSMASTMQTNTAVFGHMATFLSTCMTVLIDTKHKVNINLDTINKLFLLQKESEKQQITDKLKSMTQMERNTTMMEKSLGMGVYNTRNLEGLRRYDQDFQLKEEEFRERLKNITKLANQNRISEEDAEAQIAGNEEDHLEEYGHMHGEDDDFDVDGEGYDDDFATED